MTIPLLDRLLGTVCEPRPGAAVLARYLLPTASGGGLFMNSFPVSGGAFLVPDAGGRWQLRSGESERLEGASPRAQALDPLDSSSIRAVGQCVADVVMKGGTWLDAVDISPLVPEMSKRAELQPLEALLVLHVGHLKEVCTRPRTHLRVEIERTAVSRARRLPAQAANYLASHTEDWERPTLRAVIPKRILAVVREDQFHIYENRVAARLVDHLVTYLGRRVLEVSRLLRVFEEAGDHSTSASGGSHWRQKRVYRLWGDAIDAGDARSKAGQTLRQLTQLKYTIAGLMDSVLYREVPRRAIVSTTLTMTNILSNDVHYRRIADLWLVWARLGLNPTPRPREYFDEMQDLCRSFDRYALLLTLRALGQMGFESTTPHRALSDGETEVRSGQQTAVLSWATGDGAITLRGTGIRPLRIVPLCSSIAMLDADQLREIVADADLGRADTVTVVLYPTVSSPGAYERLEPDLSRRLYALSHEVAAGGRRHVGFMPVSPWDIGSVERVARQIRWVTMAPRFLEYPPTVGRPPVPELERGPGWLELDGDCLRVLRAPLDHERLSVDRHVVVAVEQLTALEAEHESVSLRLRDAHRDGRATGELNGRKKALKFEITKAETKLELVRNFQAELARALASVGDLLLCPTCGKRADARREFAGGPGHRFSCICSECATTWGTIACPQCGTWIPTLLPSERAWISQAKTAGWLDKSLGADVLAAPRAIGIAVGFVCQSCGESPGE